MLEDDIQTLVGQTVTGCKSSDGNNPEVFVLTFTDGTKLRVWVQAVRAVNQQKQDLRDLIDQLTAEKDAAKAQLDALNAA